MTELDLYQWIEDHNCEWQWDYVTDKKNDGILWIPVYCLESFCSLIGFYVLQSGGVECRLQDKCIAIMASEFCRSHDINLENVFKY